MSRGPLELVAYVAAVLDDLGVPYAVGGSISDRQWRDVVGILRTVGTELDREYLERTAELVGLTSLLATAWTEVEGRR